jgi:hypothetical protein
MIGNRLTSILKKAHQKPLAPLSFQGVDAILSIGGNCNPKLYLEKYIQSEPTCFFDYIGSTIAAICDIITQNWDGLNNPTLYTQFNKLSNPKDTIVTHKDHYLHFIHDVHTLENVNEAFFNKLDRRIERFESILHKSNKLLLIRYMTLPVNHAYCSPDKPVDDVMVTKLIPLLTSKYGPRDQSAELIHFSGSTEYGSPYSGAISPTLGYTDSVL